jgi:hypothetical protein
MSRVGAFYLCTERFFRSLALTHPLHGRIGNFQQLLSEILTGEQADNGSWCVFEPDQGDLSFARSDA